MGIDAHNSGQTVETLGTRVRQERRRAGLTQPALAKSAGLDSGYISYIETGKRSPSPDTVARLAAVLGVDPGWLETGQASAASQLILERLQFARFAAQHGDFAQCLRLLDQVEGQQLDRNLLAEERDEAHWVRSMALRGVGREREAESLLRGLLQRRRSSASGLDAAAVARALIDSVAASANRPMHEIEEVCLLGEQVLAATDNRADTWWWLAATVLQERARAGRPSVAVGQARQWIAALTAEVPTPAPTGFIAFIHHLSEIEIEIGDVSAALQRIHRARELCDSAGHPGDPCLELTYARALILASPPAPDLARAVLDRLAPTARGDLSLAWARERARVEIVVGEPAAAVALLGQVLPSEPMSIRVTSPGQFRDLVEAWLMMGAAMERAGDIAAALRTTAGTMALLNRRTGHAAARWWRQLGDRIDRLGGDPREVLRAYRAALDVIDLGPPRPDVTLDLRATQAAQPS